LSIDIRNFILFGDFTLDSNMLVPTGRIYVEPCIFSKYATGFIETNVSHGLTSHIVNMKKIEVEIPTYFGREICSASEFLSGRVPWGTYRSTEEAFLSKNGLVAQALLGDIMSNRRRLMRKIVVEQELKMLLFAISQSLCSLPNADGESAALHLVFPENRYGWNPLREFAQPPSLLALPPLLL